MHSEYILLINKAKGVYKMKERLFQVMSKAIEIPLNRINDDSSPDVIEEWDSLHHMNLVMALEEEFSIEFTEEHIVELTSVKAILEILDKCVVR
jgi:acyl carrier protein